MSNVRLDDLIASLPGDEQAEIAQMVSILIADHRAAAGDPWKGCLGGTGPVGDGVCPGCGKTQAEIAEASEAGHCPHLPAF